MESVTEVWRDVVGYEGEYMVSNIGNVKSMERIVFKQNGRQQRCHARMLALSCHSQGYRIVGLRQDAKRFVHRLVAEAFLGSPPDGCTDVNHKNGIKHDNRVENLEYCTRQHNVHHALRTGLQDNRGESNGMAKFTREQIQHAYDLVASGVSQKEAARKSGVSEATLSSVVTGARWGFPRISRRRISTSVSKAG